MNGEFESMGCKVPITVSSDAWILLQQAEKMRRAPMSQLGP